MGGGLVALATSLLLIAYSDGKRRAWWIGFAVFGWLYFLMLYAANSFTYTDFPAAREYLLTEQITGLLYDAISRYCPPIDPFAQPPVVGLTNNTDWATSTSAPPPFQFPPRDDFLKVAHALWTLVLAYGGGWLGHWVYFSRSPSGTRSPAPQAK